MPNQTPAIDRIFHALADPTRMAVLARLSSGPAAVSELAQPFDMALPSFLQHLRVLQDCGLVDSHKTGRVRTYQIKPEPLAAAENWLEERRQFWERRLDRFDNYLLKLKEEEHGPD